MPPASVTVRRELEWMDTDAAGIWHFTTALRFIEHAEFALHRQLGIDHLTFGHAPRVRLEMDFLSPVRFPDEVATTLTVAEVGTTSLRYDAVLQGPTGVVARGSLTCVLVHTPEQGPRPISDEMRTALTTGRALSFDEPVRIDRGT